MENQWKLHHYIDLAGEKCLLEMQSSEKRYLSSKPKNLSQNSAFAVRFPSVSWRISKYDAKSPEMTLAFLSQRHKATQHRYLFTYL